ncbi:hypothetical protein BsWGS_07258 [Bradybaena similaris]
MTAGILRALQVIKCVSTLREALHSDPLAIRNESNPTQTKVSTITSHIGEPSGRVVSAPASCRKGQRFTQPLKNGYQKNLGSKSLAWQDTDHITQLCVEVYEKCGH